MNTEISQAYDVLELMPSTEEQVQSFSSQIKDQILSGAIDWKKLLYQKKLMEKTLDAIFKDKAVDDLISEEIEKYGKGGIGINDLKFELSGKTTFDFKNCGDSKVLELEEELKKRKEFLKNIPASGIADPETGEMIYRASSTYSPFIKATKIK